MFDGFSRNFRGLEEGWRTIGGALEDDWRTGGGLEEDWRRIGGGLEEDVSIDVRYIFDRCSIDVR